MSRPFLRSAVRHLSYRPRPHGLNIPKPDTQLLDAPSDPAPIHAFLGRYTSPDRLSFPDPVALQIFTHKSFAHGREAYNEKLAFLGRRVLYLRLTEFLLSRPTSAEGAVEGRDVAQLSTARLEHLLSLESLGRVALADPALVSLLRWRPKDAGDVVGSGVRKVAAEALMALVGAVECQFGARAAKRVVDAKVLPALDVFAQ